MGVAGGPNIERDGLVFGYDTGYGVADNSTATRFYPGEPTVNSLNNSIIGTGNGASLGSDDFGTYIQLADQTTGYSRFQIPAIPVSSNETYTWSFELYSEDTITQNGNYLFDTNEYSDQFPASNDLSRLSVSQERPNTLPAGVWTPFSLTVTMKDNLTGAYSYDYFNMYYPAFQNKKIYYRNMQFEKNKEHKTPYVGQGGTRSSTESLIDLTRTTNIDVSNVSFDSTGQPTFDGTDDFITKTTNQYTIAEPWSVELVFKPTDGTDTSWNGLFGGILSQGGYWMFHNVGNLTYYEGSNAEFGTKITYRTWTKANTFTTNNYHHLTITYTPTSATTGTYNLYYNGGEKTDSFSWTFSWSHSLETQFIGRGDGRYGTNDVHVYKEYNRALTAQEVQQNFQAYKNRFNL